MKESYTQWHPALCSAIKLELVENKEDLEYTNEYNINTKPIQIDLLVIKKSSDVNINNEIGKIFRGHNIMEYKSPEDKLNLDTFIKVLGYACLYKANEKYFDEIRLEDITISLVRDSYPRELMKWLKGNKYLVTEAYPGIYYVEKEGVFPIQIIVGAKLDRNNHLWLKSLTQKMTETDVEKLVLQVEALSDLGDRNYAETILQVSMKQNLALFEKMKEEGDVVVGNIIMEFMKPEIDAVVKEAVENATREVTKEVTKDSSIKMVRRMFKQGVSYDICRATVDVEVLSDEELQAIYQNK